MVCDRAGLVFWLVNFLVCLCDIFAHVDVLGGGTGFSWGGSVDLVCVGFGCAEVDLF